MLACARSGWSARLPGGGRNSQKVSRLALRVRRRGGLVGVPPRIWVVPNPKYGVPNPKYGEILKKSVDWPYVLYPRMTSPPHMAHMYPPPHMDTSSS